ncbi:MAG: pilus assembly protein PilM [Verrucomicrobiota bacterium]
MSSPRVLAVDCGAGHVACGLIQSDKSGRLSLEKFAIETFNPDAALEGKWDQMLTQSLGELTQRAKLEGPVIIGLPGHQTLSKFIKTPAVEKSKRAKIFQFEAQQNIPYPLSEVVWDHVTVADDGLDLEVMLGAAKLDVVENACAAVGGSGLTVQQVSSSSVALLRCFRYNYPEITDSVLVVDIGARSTNLLFVENQRFFIRTIPLAGNTITQSIAEEIKQDFAHSESLKVQVLSGTSELPATSPARTAVANAVQSFVGRLQLEITRSTVNYRRQSGAEQPVAVYLSGGGSLIDNAASLLSERLKMPVERLDPLRNVTVGPAAGEASECTSVLAGMIGLAVAPAKGESAFSLLPPSIGEKLAFRRRQPLLIAAAALAALVFIPPLLQSQRLLSAYQSEARAYEQATAPFQQNQSRLEQNREQIQQAREQVEAIRSLVESKANWINFLTDLQDRLHSVGDVWIEQLKVQRPEAKPVASQSGGLFGGGAVEPTEDGEAKAPEIIRLQVSGRLMDYNNPVSRVSQDSYERVKTLLESFVGSRFISAIENDSYNADQPGILRFDFVLVVDPQRPL